MDKTANPSLQVNAASIVSCEDTLELRERIISACRFLMGIGFLIGTWGNIGVRLEEGLIVTPSRIDFGLITPDDLVVVDWEGNRIKGQRVPSSEMELHRLILLKRPDLGASVHTHSPYASAVSCAQHSIPVISEDVSQVIGGKVSCSRYVPAGRHHELAQAAWEVMGQDSSAVLLSNHGPVVGGRDLAEAIVAAQVLEKAAMAMLLTSSIGGPVTIADDLVKEERHRFLYRYGKE